MASMSKSGRPRNAALDTAILAATLSILRTGGYARLRIADVAKLAGVPKTTIYRRWKSRTHLVVAAMEHALGEVPAPNTSDPLERITTLLHSRAQLLGGNDNSLLGVALDLHQSKDRDLHEEYRQRIIDPVRSEIIATLTELLGTYNEKQTVDAENFADATIGGLLYKTAILGETLSKNDISLFLRCLLLSTNLKSLESPGR